MQTSFSNPDADTRALTGDFFSRFGPVSFDASSGAAAKQNPADSRRVKSLADRLAAEIPLDPKNPPILFKFGVAALATDNANDLVSVDPECAAAQVRLAYTF
jgi:hypothetical protein